MTKEALGVGAAHRTQGLADGAEQVRIGPGLGLAQVSFDFGPHHFDRVEIGTVGGQEEQLGSASFDELLCFGVAVGREIIADHEITRAQGGAEHLADIFPKDVRVGGPPECDRGAFGPRAPGPAAASYWSWPRTRR